LPTDWEHEGSAGEWQGRRLSLDQMLAAEARPAGLRRAVAGGRRAGPRRAVAGPGSKPSAALVQHGVKRLACQMARQARAWAEFPCYLTTMTVFRTMALSLGLGLLAACDDAPRPPAPVPAPPRTEPAPAPKAASEVPSAA